MEPLTSFTNIEQSQESSTTNRSTDYGVKIKDTIAKLNTKNIMLLPVISFTLIVVLLTINIFLAIHQSIIGSNFEFDQNSKTSTIINKVDDINSQMQQLNASPTNSTDFKLALTNINVDLRAIEKSVTEVAKTTDVDKVSTQISSMKTDVDSQMSDIKRIVVNDSGSKQYLDPSILPFQVISIDVLSEQPFVTINYLNHITPLAIGDTIAGWKITNADYDSSIAEFENNKNQFVKVATEG